MATGSYLTPNHSRSQSEIQGDLHKYAGNGFRWNVFSFPTSESEFFSKGCLHSHACKDHYTHKQLGVSENFPARKQDNKKATTFALYLCAGSGPMRKYSILFVCATKVRLSKQQDEDHERYAAQRYPTHVQSVTYPANTQAKEEAVPAANQDRI
ncbi:uncharacterized protein TNCV_3966681 [Trichonephila clavipes]|nr:uncharacterized protein TNCV_3966681 [Trichonephila clavipes]